MRICAFQPKYPFLAAETDEYIRFLLETMDQCYESMDLIVLPECCNAPSKYANKEEFFSYVKKNTQVLLDKARETAIRCNAIISMNLYYGPLEKLRNETLVFNSSGEICYTYCKQHLPEPEVYENRVDDSYTYEYHPLSVVEIQGIRFGFLTCYDAYFNEFIANMARENLDVILYPSHQRGEKEYILEMEARNIAFNCNAYVIRSSISMGKGSDCGGNTMVVAPDGQVLACINQEVGTLVCDIEPKQKHYHCNAYGNEDILTQEFIERCRKPWAYRPAGPTTVPGENHTAYPRVCSHRGFNKYAPENTMAAFGISVALGADELEMDVWPTKDHRFVVCHDDSVDRTSNGTGKICDLTWDEISRFDIGGKSSPVLTGLKFPLFDEVLQKFSNQVIINLHIKSVGEVEEYNHDDFRRLVDLIYQYDCQRHVYIAGEEDVLRTAKKLAPELPRCALDRHKDFKLVELAKEYGCTKVQLCKNRTQYFFNQEMIDDAKAAGIHCNLFWSNDPEETMRMLEMGVNTILTDDYLRIAAVVEQYRQKMSQK